MLLRKSVHCKPILIDREIQCFQLVKAERVGDLYLSWLWQEVRTWLSFCEEVMPRDDSRSCIKAFLLCQIQDAKLLTHCCANEIFIEIIEIIITYGREMCYIDMNYMKKKKRKLI